MSGILAVIGDVRDSRVEAALGPLRNLGGEKEQRWSEGDALIVVTRKAWQLDDDFSGNVLVLETPDLVVAADASLFDKKGLARKLSTAGVRAQGETSSHFIEAAYRAWGPGMVAHLDGDYAFVVWERAERRLFAARSPIIGRPLYLTRVGGALAVASSSRGLAELRGTTKDLNLAALGGQVAGLAWSNGVDTVYRGVETLRPGHRLDWREGSPVVEAFWEPRAELDRRPVPLAEAAEELRELLMAAVAQRLGRGPTSVWMSGGWDSTAVFAAGQNSLPESARNRLRPVSISYPEGDPGREDTYINLVAQRWSAEVHWIHSEDLRLLDGLDTRAGGFDEPPVHLYELWNRGLARGTRATGSRVALDGVGGDQLFQVSDIVLADLLRTGHGLGFASRARSRWHLGWRHVVRLGVLPLVPDPVIRLGEHALGRRIPRHYLERSMTDWVDREFAAEWRLRERDLGLLRTARGRNRAQAEGQLYLTLPVWSWGSAFMRGVLLEEGIEVRSPLLDLRVAEFALGRPVAERWDGRETKILLRRAMRGLVPEEVLAPRRYRTGATVGFSRARMREAYPGLIAKLFAEPLVLEALGIVDARDLRAAADRYLGGDRDEFLRVNLFHTMKVEFWLRGNERRAALRRPSPEADASAVSLPAA